MSAHHILPDFIILLIFGEENKLRISSCIRSSSQLKWRILLNEVWCLVFCTESAVSLVTGTFIYHINFHNLNPLVKKLLLTNFSPWHNTQEEKLPQEFNGINIPPPPVHTEFWSGNFIETNLRVGWMITLKWILNKQCVGVRLESSGSNK
jgi:hypothetical protein